MSSSQKTSQFSTLSTLLDSSLISVVSNGQNYTVPYSSLKTNLGALGTLSTEGSALGTPILLEPSAGNYQIRNLESSKGIIASASAENGVVLANNFTQSATGTKLIPDLNAAQYKLKTLVGGTNIALSDNGDEVTIGFNPTAGASKTVVVSTINDFPDSVGGVITLAPDTDYLIASDITTAHRFMVSNPNTIRAASSQMVELKYTGTGDMFTGVDPNFKVVNITLSAPSGTVFNTTSPSGLGIVQMVESNIQECQFIGTMDGNFITRFTNVAFEDIQAGGITFTGAHNILVIDVGVAFLGGGSLIDLGTATFNTVSVFGGNIATSAVGTVFLSGAANSANINVGGLGAVINNSGFGSGAALSGITTDDARWNFQANNNIPNTRPDGLLSFQTPTTTVLAAATPKLITGTWVVQRTSQMTGTAAGRITYNGERNVTVPISATLSIVPVSGTNKVVNVYFAKNGSVITASKISAVISSGSARNLAVNWQDSLAGNDYYEVFIESVDGTDLTVNTANLRVN
ncbi:hypothetical protein [Pseudoalteromonas sp.]|uniref:hypothetical protein n=1 Tax=Pseudoalteromonas sp. TaxID=53249 RepID=UPI0035691625